MRETIVLSTAFLLLLMANGCGKEVQKVDVPRDPGNPDSPIVVSDTSSMVNQKNVKATKTAGSGHIKNFGYIVDGPGIAISESSQAKKYQVTQVTFASQNGKDSNGNTFTPVVIPLTGVQWTLLLNNSYKLYSSDDETVSITATGTPPAPFTLTPITDGQGNTTSWDLANSQGAFDSLVLAKFDTTVLFPTANAPTPAAGYWLITFDYCKQGNCH